MRKLLLLLSLCALGTHGLKAQKAQDYFIHMPDSICPLLTAVNRADFIDFMDSRMKAEVTNRLAAFGPPEEVWASGALEEAFGVKIGRCRAENGWHYYYL